MNRIKAKGIVIKRTLRSGNQITNFYCFMDDFLKKTRKNFKKFTVFFKHVCLSKGHDT